MEKESVEIFTNKLKKVEVESITLDSFIDQFNIKHIDVLKVDIQGAELRMLEGAKNTMKLVKIGFFEISFLDKNIIGLILKLRNYFCDTYRVINPVYMGADLMFFSKTFEQNSVHHK